jgi:hypothetical protein
VRFLNASRAEARRVERERQTTQLLRYLRQAGGLALGAGLGYGVALAYLVAAEKAGALLLRPMQRDPGALVVAFFALFLPGALVGFSIGLAMWRWNANKTQKVITTTAIGAGVGLICYSPFVIFADVSRSLTLTTILPALITGALLGISLGLGSTLVHHKGWRLVAIFLACVLAGTIGHAIGGFAPRADGLSAAIAGGLIGGLTGLALYFVALEQDVSIKI